MSRVSQLQPHPYECVKRSSPGRARDEARGSSDRVCTYSRHRWGVTVYSSDGTSRPNMKVGEKLFKTSQGDSFTGMFGKCGEGTVGIRGWTR